MHRFLLVFCFGFCLCNSAHLIGQQISGKVYGEEKGDPVKSANIVLQPGNYGTITNSNGEFRFESIPVGKFMLTVSMVGFKTKKVDIEVLEGKTTSQNIALLSDISKIDEVTVLGNYRQMEIMEYPLREPVSLMPAISKISEVEIQKQGATTLTEALKFVSGGWTETRGRKVKQLFSIRGQKYPYPAYSINGIWQKEFHEMPYFFNSSNIEEVKIVRSSAALLKSLSALTGVIDVRTKQPEKRESELFVKYGSLNSYHGGVSHGNSTEKFSYRAGVNGVGTSGPQGQNGKERIWNAHGFFQWKINSKLDLSVNIFYLYGMRQLIQPIEPADQKFQNAKEEYDPIHTLLSSIRLQYKANAKFSSELLLNYVGRNLEYHIENLMNGTYTEYPETDYELTINQINARALGSNNTMRFGALYNYWIAPEGKRFYYGRKAEVHTISGVVTDQHNFGKLLVDAGFRLTHEYYAEWGGFNIEGSGGKFSNVESIVDQWQSPVWQATSGLSYSLPSNSSLHFSFAGGVVNPRKGALNEEGETPENETRLNIDLGYVNNFTQSGKISFTTFWINRINAIEYSGETIETVDNGIMELYQNSHKRNFGIEFEIKSPVIANYYSFFSNFTLMKGEIYAEEKWEKDDEMPNIIANTGCNFQKNRFDLNAYVNYTGAYKNDRFVSKAYIAEYGKAPLGDFTIFDLSAGYLVGKDQNIRFFLEGKNLFDKKYQTVPGYPDYGRIVSAGVNVKL